MLALASPPSPFLTESNRDRDEFRLGFGDAEGFEVLSLGKRNLFKR